MKIISFNSVEKFLMYFFFRHPLFPLLALLFEKCELATQSNECPTSESFNLDIQAFVQHQDRESKPFLSDNQEVNDLVNEMYVTGIL